MAVSGGREVSPPRAYEAQLLGAVREGSMSLGSAEPERQLTSQIDINTSLLQRLHEAEKKQLADQEATQNREALLAETRRLLNTLNDENAELRERYGQMVSELEAARVEAESLKGEKGETEGNLKQLNFNLLYQMKEKNMLVEALQASLRERDTALAEQRSAAESLRSELRSSAASTSSLHQEHSRVCAALAGIERQCDEVLQSYAPEAVSTQPVAVDRRLESVIDALLRKARTVEDSRRKEAQRAAVLDAQCAGMSARVESLETACVELRRRGDAQVAQSGGTQKQLERQLDEARAAAQQSLAELVRAKTDSIAQGEHALKRVERSMSDVAAARAELLSIERSCDRAAAQCGSHQMTLDALASADSEAEQALLRAASEASAASQRIGAEELTQRRRAEEAQSAAVGLRDECARLREQSALAFQQLDQQKRERELLETQASDLQAANQALEQQVRDAAQHRLWADQAIGDLERGSQDLQQQLQQQLARADTAERDRTKYSAEHREASEAHLSLRAEMSRREEEWRTRVAAEREHHQAALRQSEEKVAQLKAALEKLAIQLDKANDVCRVVTDHRDSLRTENDRLRKDLDEHHRRQADRTARALASPAGSPMRRTATPLQGGRSASASPATLGVRPSGTHAVYSRAAWAAPRQSDEVHTPQRAQPAPVAAPPPAAPPAAAAEAVSAPPPFAASPADALTVPGADLSATPATPPLALIRSQQPQQFGTPAGVSSPSVLRDSVMAESADDVFSRRMRELDSYNRHQQALEERLTATLAQMKGGASPSAVPWGEGEREREKEAARHAAVSQHIQQQLVRPAFQN
eukprot:TRINITY_DN1197_c0_g3_i1.p1 TRINITY_DN1197_c0_g3~~TRINITY_DN1197_c0_g3_i1.p1  ORF type:complete len:837 (+),score=295.96 TRINITY_DN1197_c0_g3_i1:54-2513(+)